MIKYLTAPQILGDDAVDLVRSPRSLARAHDQIGHVGAGGVDKDALERAVGVEFRGGPQRVVVDPAMEELAVDLPSEQPMIT